MQFSSKAYLYYFILNGESDINKDCISDMVDILGEIDIKPGSLNKKDGNYKWDKISYGEARLENSNIFGVELECSSKGNIFVLGYINSNPILLGISKIDPENKSARISFSIIEKDKGLHMFATDMYCPHFGADLTKYSFYDVGTLKALKEDFGYSEKQILDMDSNGLKKLGFSPDDISYIRNEELGLDTYTFAHKILTSASFDNLKEDLENLNGNNEYTKYYKKLIYDEKSYK